jgi:hypothetical protein
LKILYYDCFAGISGDMNLGALVDLGVDKQYLIEELNKLSIKDEFEVKISQNQKMGITGTKVEVELKKDNHHHHHEDHHQDNQHSDHTHEDHHGHNHKHHHDHDHEHEENHHHRNLKDIFEIIENSELSKNVKKISKEIFKIVAEAEGKVHGKTVEEVHFHEVGAVDSIVDIVGAALCIDKLGVDKVISSTVELGGGFVKCAHGIMPVPAPATSEIVKNMPVHLGKVRSETTTPTGAAILKGTVDEYADDLKFKILKTGYGLGTKDFPIPNVLRVYLGELENKNQNNNSENIVIETNIDDMTPEMLGYVEEKLLELGALDVYRTSIIMKKGRLASNISILVEEYKEKIIEEALFKETSTLGFKKYKVGKIRLQRDFIDIQTKYGEIPVKLGIKDGKILKFKPEYDKCKEIAQNENKPLIDIYEEINKYDIEKIWREKNDK